MNVIYTKPHESSALMISVAEGWFLIDHEGDEAGRSCSHFLSGTSVTTIYRRSP